MFLDVIDLDMIYFLYRAGEIRHMLLMAWGGESIGTGERLAEISRSRKVLRKLGVVHGDLRLPNMLWNNELGQVLIIDFHRARIDSQLVREHAQSLKRSRRPQEAGESKRRRLLYT